MVAWGGCLRANSALFRLTICSVSSSPAKQNLFRWLIMNVSIKTVIFLDLFSPLDCNLSPFSTCQVFLCLFSSVFICSLQNSVLLYRFKFILLPTNLYSKHLTKSFPHNLISEAFVPLLFLFLTPFPVSLFNLLQSPCLFSFSLSRLSFLCQHLLFAAAFLFNILHFWRGAAEEAEASTREALGRHRVHLCHPNPITVLKVSKCMDTKGGGAGRVLVWQKKKIFPQETFG